MAMDGKSENEAAKVAGNLAGVREKIAAAATQAGRPADAARLIAVSKSQDIERIEAALGAGQRVFGENRVQEAQTHWADRRSAYPDLELHFIGHLQSNKVAEAVALFDVIQCVDRPKLARALAREIAGSGRRVRLFVQVNIGEEKQKGGVAPAQAEAFIAECREQHGLEIEGVMCIPPVDEEPAPYFALLAGIAGRAGVKYLSMGMTQDYETAVRLGATHVRVGRAIFGPRQSPPEA
ncbi:MAG: YggS family pyridoxal phosphate-dependent enzyme [Alphaproteobacteria bacterium]